MDVESMIEMVVEHALWDKLAEGIHGEKHWLRVFKLADKIMSCLMLARKTKLVVNKGMVGMAALLHDIGRVNDGADPDHGYRGAPIAFKLAASLMAQGQNKIALATPKGFYAKMAELGRIADIVSRHCLPGPGDYLEMQIVKDADKLDRVRLGGPDAVDLDQLALPVSKTLIDTAVKLYEQDSLIVV